MAVSTTATIPCVYYDKIKDPNHQNPEQMQVAMRFRFPSCKPWDTTCAQQGGAWVPAITVCQQQLWL